MLEERVNRSGQGAFRHMVLLSSASISTYVCGPLVDVPHNLLSQSGLAQPSPAVQNILHALQSAHSAASSILIFAIAGVQVLGAGSRAHRVSDNGEQRAGGRTAETEVVLQLPFPLRRVRVVNERSTDKPT